MRAIAEPGRLAAADETQSVLDRLLSLGNEVGLLAEEYASYTRRQLGNLTQVLGRRVLARTTPTVRSASIDGLTLSGERRERTCPASGADRRSEVRGDHLMALAFAGILLPGGAL